MFKNKEGFSTTSYTTTEYLSYPQPADTSIRFNAIDSSGNIYITQLSSLNDISLWEDNRIFKMTPGATSVITLYTTIPRLSPQCMAFDSSQNLYIFAGSKLYKITDGGSTITHYAGERGVGRRNGPRLTAGLNGNIFSMVFDSADNLYMSEYSNGCITKISTDGEVSTYAGPLPGEWEDISLDGNGNSARFKFGLGVITVDSIGNLFVLDYGKIRKISTSREVTTVLTITTTVYGMTTDSRNNLYILDSHINTYRIRIMPYNSTTLIDFVSGPFGSGPLLRDSLGNFYTSRTVVGRPSKLYKTSQSCLAGSYLNDGTCDLCPLGTYSAANATSCTSCPDNTSTSLTGRTSSNQCTSAAEGYYMSGGTAMPCPSNATCAGGTASFSCFAGYKKNGAGCEECALGTWSAAGATTCTTCTAGRTTPSTGSSNVSQCTSVLSTHYMNGTTLTLCPSNAICDGGPSANTPSFNCVAGYKKNAASNACEECGLGFYGTGGTCSECPANTTTSLTRRTLLSDCTTAIGFFMSGGIAERCPDNTTTPSTGSTSRNQCTASEGYYMSGGAAISCPSNASCPGGTASFTCSNGYKKNAEGTACEECGTGSYGIGGTCILCPPNTTTSLTARTSSNDCTTSPGFYMSATGSVSCPSNAFCSGGSAPFVCSNGYETRGSACISCDIGFYGTGGTCTPCSNIPATDSTAIWTTRAIGQTSCIADTCKPNYKMNALSNNCEPCPSNTRGTNCTNASEGYYMSNGVPVLCPPNSRCDGGSGSFVCSNGYETSDFSCVSCGLGFYGTGGSCVSCSNVPATDSTATWTTRTTGQTSCVADSCKPNFKFNALSNSCDPCPRGTSGINCINASVGYYMTETGLESCPSNAFCSGGLAPFVCSNGYETSGSACVLCGVGFYGTGGTCVSCSSVPATDSTESWTTRLTGQTSCIADRCKPNYKINEETNNCESCPSNTGGLNCTSASLGYYMSGTTPVPCPSNASCAGGSASFVCSNDYILNSASNGCDPCPSGTAGLNCTTILPGYYNNGSRTLICPSNAFCAGGSVPFVCSNNYILNSASNGCDPCPSGTAGLNCTTILPGYYNNGSRTLICPSNATCAGGSASFVCADGYMMNETGDGCVRCPDGKGGLNCTETLAGYYLNGSNAVPCPSNATCTGGSVPFVCSNDYIMNAERNACDPCPRGSAGLNCRETLSGYYLTRSGVVPCPSNARCAGGSVPFVCSNDYIMNAASNGCDPCSTGTSGLNCTTILPGYYNNGSRTLICPSNATCAGGSNSFVCNNGYMLNERGDGCVKCPDGKGGPNCTEALPGYYLNGTNAVACPSNAICTGGIATFTCSNGYYLHRRTGTCKEITSCRGTECSLLFRDGIIGNRLPTNYSVDLMQRMNVDVS